VGRECHRQALIFNDRPFVGLNQSQLKVPVVEVLCTAGLQWREYQQYSLDDR
jgi:hypothetical protein